MDSTLNLNRRHLNESQRAMIAAKLANMQKGGMRDAERANLPIRENEVSTAEAAEKQNVSERAGKAAEAIDTQSIREKVCV